MLLGYIRTGILYSVLILSIRLMGKRQIGEMEPTEFVVTMLVANLAAIPMQDGGIPLYSGVMPILTVLGMELVLSGISFLSLRFRRILCGKPVILIWNGKVDQEALKKTMVTQDELTGHLREKDVLEISQVQYAILETNGTLSVFPYPKYSPASAKDAGIQASNLSYPITLVSQGHLLKENLRLCGKTAEWVQSVLKEKGANIENTWMLTLDTHGKLGFVPKEGA